MGRKSVWQLSPAWTASTAHAASGYEQPVYIAESCPHGYHAVHSLQEAVTCGLLQAVRAQREVSQETAARQVGVSVGAWRDWEQHRRLPTVGAVCRGLEAWLSQ